MADARGALDTTLKLLLDSDATLLNLATGGVHSVMGPDHLAPPWVIFQAVSNNLTRPLSSSSRWHEFIYLIKAVTPGRWPLPASDIDSQIQATIEGAALSVTGFTHVTGACWREEDFYLTEITGSKIFQHQGGMYRIELEEND